MKSRDHLFQPGRSGNEHGRPRGALNKTTLAVQALLDGEAKALTRRCIDLALEGDSTALKLCLNSLLPPKRENPVSLDLPALEGSQDALKAIARVVEAVAGGEIAPAEGQAIASLLESHRRTFEVEELEHRIGLLETQVCGGN